VLCSIAIEEDVPPWLRGQGQGWVTAEYARSTLPVHGRERTGAGGKGTRKFNA